jgi:hypothetical protein
VLDSHTARTCALTKTIRLVLLLHYHCIIRLNYHIARQMPPEIIETPVLVDSHAPQPANRFGGRTTDKSLNVIAVCRHLTGQHSEAANSVEKGCFVDAHLIASGIYRSLPCALRASCNVSQVDVISYRSFLVRGKLQNKAP